MTQNILEIIDVLPPRVKELHDSAYALAGEELRVPFIDSSVFLLAIIKLGNSNASAKWLFRTGITEKTVVQLISEDFAGRRVQASREQEKGRDAQPISPILGYTPSTVKMVLHLHARHRRSPRTAAYVSNVLEAVAHSDSGTVQRVFRSVGLDMTDVRSALNTPSITDLGVLRARR